MLPVFNIVRLFLKIANPTGKMISHYCFICIFQVIGEAQNVTIYLTITCVSSSVTCLLGSFIHFSI